MYFEVDERLRWALRLRAALESAPSIADLVEDILRNQLAEQLAEYDRRQANGEIPEPVKSKRGRKPKPRP